MLLGAFQRKSIRRLLCQMLLAWHELAISNLPYPSRASSSRLLLAEAQRERENE